MRLAIRLLANIKVMFSYLKTIRSSFLLKIVALTLVTATIASSFFFIDSFQPKFSTNYMTNIKSDQSDVSLSFDFSYEDYLVNSSGTVDEYKYANKLADTLSTQFQINVGNDSLSTILTQESTTAFSFTKDANFSLTLVNANDYYLEQLDDFSVEQNSSIDLVDGGILILEYTYMQYYPNEVSIFNESYVIFGDGFTDISENNFTLDFHSKIIWDLHDDYPSNEISKINGQPSIAIIVSDTIFKNYLAFINSTASIYDISINALIDMDYSKLNFDDRALLEEGIYQFVYFTQEYIMNEFSFNADITYKLFIILHLADLNKALVLIDILALTFTIPTILISLLILYFSNEYFANKRTNLFSFYYSKGTSIQQLLFFIITEFVFSLVLAFILGLGFSIPLTMLMVRNPNLFGFQNTIAIEISNPLSINYLNILWIFLIVIVLGSLSALRNIKPILTLTKDNENLDTKEDTIRNVSLWKKLYLDFLLLFIGVGIIIIEKAFFQEYIHDFITQFCSFFIGIIVIISAIALILIRFIPNLISLLRNYFRTIFDGLFSFSIKLFNIRKKTFTRNVVAITVIVSYLLILVQTNATINQFSTEKAYFDIGADVRINLSAQSNLPMLIDSLPLNVLYTEVTKIQIQNYLIGDLLVFYIINPNTFLTAAYFKENFILNEPSEAISKLSQNLTILSNREVANSNSWEIGYSYSLTTTYGSSDRLSLTVVDYFGSWPFFFENDKQIEGIPFVIGKGTSEVFIENNTDVNQFLLLNVPDKEHNQIVNYLENEVITSNETLVTINDGYLQFWEEPSWYILNTFSVTNFYLIGLLFLIISFINITILEINRKKEISLFIALGISRKQIFFLSLIEQLSILFSGLSFGFIIGMPSLTFLINQMKYNFSISVGKLDIYWIVGIIFLGLLLLNIIAIMSWSLRSSTKKYKFFIQELELQNESYD
ncbi:MAG: FtsX-like permease family protein [Candidatus Heimdallarchaeota archaeon]